MKSIITACCCVLSFLYGHAQATLTGTVLDGTTNDPLAAVSVYLPQLERGTMTDEQGQFTINGLPEGTYKLVASYLGYQTHSESLEISGQNTTLSINLVPSAIEMEEVIVSTPFHKLQRENVMKVERANIKELQNQGAVTLAEGITRVAGVQQVSTGVGIGKPVIRGLSGNRVLVYTQGVRLENQQFGDEHGLGVNGSGIESIEVIKGPASLLYGSDAMGGVLYLNPERFAEAGASEADVNLDYLTNTTGFRTNAGFLTSTERFKFLVRGATSNHADYRTGTGDRVTNSRFREYDVKTGLGYQMNRFKGELRYNYLGAVIGIPEEIGEQTGSYRPLLPYQKVDNHIVSAKNTWFFKNSSLETTLGYTFNNRKEFEDHHHGEEEGEVEEGFHEEEEGEEGPALHIRLATFSYNLQYHLPRWGGLETVFGIQGMQQRNENFGEEILIPDATTNDIGLLAVSHLHFENNSDLQLGLRFDRRAIEGDEYGAPGDTEFIPALDRSFTSFNAALGYKIDLSPTVLGRANIASGFRAPNLAELTSNGTHEGTNRYEIGNPDLNQEQNVQVDMALEYKNEHIEVFVNGFYNILDEYIFLEPNGEFVGEDPVFLYRQQNAELYGGEIGLHLHPHPLDWLHIESTFESVIGKLRDGNYLPLLPANSLTNTVRVEGNDASGWWRNTKAFVTLQSVFRQGRVSPFETPTDGYALVHLGLGGELWLGNRRLEVRISANNILDKAYVAHLSRLKVDGVPNMGRNLTIGLGLPLD